MRELEVSPSTTNGSTSTRFFSPPACWTTKAFMFERVLSAASRFQKCLTNPAKGPMLPMKKENIKAVTPTTCRSF